MTDAPSTAAPPKRYRVSPSSGETFLACPARWGYAKLPGGTDEPGSDATEFGTETHAERERYLEHVKLFGAYEFPDTRAGVVARALTEHLPKGIPPYAYWEEDQEYDAGDGVVFHGFPDFAWPDFRNGVAVTADYKTTGSMRYAKLERDDLFGHPQAPLYALFNMRRWGFDKGRCLWLYAERPPLVRPPTGWPTVRVVVSDHTISRDEATERVHLRLVPPAKQMLAYYTSGMTAADAGTLPKNLRHCRAYGRLCPRYSQCQPEKSQHMSDQAHLFLAGLGLGAASAPVTSPVTAPADGPAGNPPPPTPDTPPAVNPPEAAGKGKGKGRAAGPVQIDAATIDAIAEAVADKLALRLVRHVP